MKSQEKSSEQNTEYASVSKVEARLARLEAYNEVILAEVRELRAVQKDLATQILKIRTTDFRVLMGMIVSVGVGLGSLIFKTFGA